MKTRKRESWPCIETAVIVLLGLLSSSVVSFGDDAVTVTGIHVRFLPPCINTVSVVHARDLVQRDLMPSTSEMTLVDPDAELIAEKILKEAGVTNETIINEAFVNDKMDTTAVFEFKTKGAIPIRVAYKFVDKMNWVNIDAKPLTKSQVKELLTLLPAFVWTQVEKENASKSVSKPK